MAHLGNTIVNGALRVIGGEYVDTINGVTVGSSPKFTDTTYSAGSNITLTGTAFSLTKANVTGALGYTPPTSDTNNAVTQTATTTSADYEVLFSVTADNTTRTEGARKNSNLKFNPSTGNLQATQLNGVAIGSSPKFTDNDTKNTAGSTDSSSKLFLIGATSQAANPQTYSHDTAYVGTDGCLYSGGTKVLTAHQDISGKVNKSGDTMTGDLIFNKTGATDLTQVQMKCGANDYGRIAAGATESNAGYLEIATADDGTEPIYVRQYGGTFTTKKREAILLDASGNTSFPNKLSAKIFQELITGSGTAAQDKGSGVSPRYFPAKWTFNTGQTVTNGDIITIKIPCAGHDYGVFISIDNGTTYKPVSTSGTSRLTTHYGNASYLTLIYKSDGGTNNVYAAAGADARSNVTGGCWLVCNYYDTGNTYDRNRFNANIKAWGTKIIAGNIIVGINGLYHHLKEGTAFDITYPILYLNGDCNASATTTNTYDIINFTITTTQSITLTAYKPVYIKGTLSGTTFTPNSTAPLTQTVPTSADGKYYMFLGNATSTTAVYLTERHEIYAYKNGAFGQIVNDALSVNGYTVAKSVPSNAVFTDNDTKNTAGSTDSSSKLFLIGATSQAANPQTYSHDTAYVGTDGCLYSGGTKVLTAHQNISGKLDKSGGTMTGQLKTSFNSSVAMGSYGAAATTIPNLCTELRYSSGCCGSFNLGTAYTLNNVTLAKGWYNFLWIPHRSGGNSGAADGDNCNYGCMYITGMTVAGSYVLRYSNSAIADLYNLHPDRVIYSGSVSAAVNATTCTINDGAITTSSTIEPFSSNSSGNVIAITKIAVSAGKVVLTFPKLTEATSFKVRITN